MVFISETQFKANLHCHSVESDGKYEPSYLKEIYKNMGYQILCISDHEKPLDHSELTEDGFLLLTGYEAYIRLREDGQHDGFLPEMHLNLFARRHDLIDQIWPNSSYLKYFRDPEQLKNHPVYGPTTPRLLTTENVNEFIRLAQEDGYLVVYNHPGWSLQSAGEIMQYNGLVSMEMSNGNALSIGRPEYNANTYDYLLQHGYRLYCHAADDNHNRIPLGKPGCDSFLAFTMFNLRDDKLTYDNVIDALDHGTFYASNGPEIRHLEIDGNHVYIRTTPARHIAMLTNGQFSRCSYGEHWGDTITEAEFTIPNRATYVRFNVLDEQNRNADTRGFFRDTDYFLS